MTEDKVLKNLVENISENVSRLLANSIYNIDFGSLVIHKTSSNKDLII